MGTSLRAVDLVKVLKRELELGRERFDASPDFAMWEGREFIEEGLYDSWIKDYHRKLEDKTGKNGLSREHKTWETSRTYISIITQGTKRSPAHSKMWRKRARRGPPRTMPRAQPLIMSIK